MRFFSLFLCVFCLLACSSNQEVEFKKQSFDQAVEMAKASGKKILIDFWADG